METGGRTHPDRLWIGAIPAGLFRSDDRGESWQLDASLWNMPERKRWFGGGYDAAGIHSISPDPRDDDRIFLAISCGGVWESNDAGDTWSALGKGPKACSRPMCRRSRPKTARSRIRTGWCAVRRLRT
jgi:photosystem II stability/assembly factor-like uncharacterized protein